MDIRRALRHAFAAAFLAAAFLVTAASAQTLTVISWNVESGGSPRERDLTRLPADVLGEGADPPPLSLTR